jgi:hypothetical protein
MVNRKNIPQAAAIALSLAALAVPAFAEPHSPKALANDVIEHNAEQIATVGDTVYYFAELGMQEVESTKFLKGVLESIGFTVETGGAGMPTNIWGEWGTGKPQIVIVSEIDALPGGSQTPGSIEHKPLGTARLATWRATTPMRASPSARRMRSSRRCSVTASPEAKLDADYPAPTILTWPWRVYRRA